MIDLVAETPSGARLGQLDNAQLSGMLAQGVPVVDIRRPSEWNATGVIAGSRLMTFFDERGDFDLEAWLVQLESVAGPAEPLVLVCRLGQRTTVLGRYLAGARGYRSVHHLTAGITWWIAAGLPVVAPPDGE